MHTPVCQNTFAFCATALYKQYKKKSFEKTTVCNEIADYAAHVFYLVTLALRILDDTY